MSWTYALREAFSGLAIRAINLFHVRNEAVPVIGLTDGQPPKLYPLLDTNGYLKTPPKPDSRQELSFAGNATSAAIGSAGELWRLDSALYGEGAGAGLDPLLGIAAVQTFSCITTLAANKNAQFPGLPVYLDGGCNLVSNGAAADTVYITISKVW